MHDGRLANVRWPSAFSRTGESHRENRKNQSVHMTFSGASAFCPMRVPVDKTHVETGPDYQWWNDSEKSLWITLDPC